MSGVQGKRISPWVDTMQSPQLGDPSLREASADVVLIGAGVVGLTTALLLQQAGNRVTVVEAGRLAESVTAHSTVKVTVGHGTVYSKIARRRGMDAAKAYAEANQAGFRTILQLAGDLGIDCMLEQGPPHVIYAESPDEVGKIEEEARVAHQLGLDVSLTNEVPLPFGVARAVAFGSQAHFHPGRYLAGLAEALVAAGGGRCRGRARDRRRRAAGGLPGGDVSAGMTINVGSPTHSTRSVVLGGEELLIVVGEGHGVGHVTRPTNAG